MQRVAKKTSNLAAAIKRAKQKCPSMDTAPLWSGPSGAGPNGGVTQGLLSRFLVCRERFRLYAVKGLRPADTWNHRLGYGNMWHICEESQSLEPLRSYVETQCKRYPLQQEQILHWYSVCQAQFPIYVRYWAQHPETEQRTTLLSEQTFDVPYILPSKRIVRLRGKWDRVELIKKGKEAGIYLFEHKTRGDINEQQIKRQLTFDLQTMFYLVALESHIPDICRALSFGRNLGLKGVRYNVVRRPLSGGKGTIVRHQPTKKNPQGESAEEFYARLAGIIAESPETYFARWPVGVSGADITRFWREFLDPILEQLCEWYDWILSNPSDVFRAPREDPYRAVHWRHPFGVFNPLDEGGSSDVDSYLESGSTVGLRVTDILFEELA